MGGHPPNVILGSQDNTSSIDKRDTVRPNLRVRSHGSRRNDNPNTQSTAILRGNQRYSAKPRFGLLGRKTLKSKTPDGELQTTNQKSSRQTGSRKNIHGRRLGSTENNGHRFKKRSRKTLSKLVRPIQNHKDHQEGHIQSGRQRWNGPSPTMERSSPK